MRNYFNGKIYKILSDSRKEVYLGCTTQDLDERLATHKHYSNKSRKFRKFFRCKDLCIVLIEHYDCNNVEQLKARLEFWQETFFDINFTLLNPHNDLSSLSNTHQHTSNNNAYQPSTLSNRIYVGNFLLSITK